MRCCPRNPDHYAYHGDNVTFVNLKTKYDINEDLAVDYVLHNNIVTSTRDWIGIFPRGWTNLQQYLTFEYAFDCVKNANLSQRSILFLSAFLQQALPNTEYQFVYVSKSIQVLAMSFYFRFTSIGNFNQDLRNQSTCKADRVTSPTGFSPYIAVSDHILQKTDNFATSSVAGTKSIPRNTLLQKMGSQKICQYCRMPTVRFLISHNNCLVGRIGRLERDLGIAEEVVKHAKMARSNLWNRLQAYEAFVAEMLRSLIVKGMVKITDQSGKEMILRRVDSKKIDSDCSMTRGKKSDEKTSSRERELETVIEEQKIMIDKLEKERDRYHSLLKTYKNSSDKLSHLEKKIVNSLKSQESVTNDLFTVKEFNSHIFHSEETNVQCASVAERKSQSVLSAEKINGTVNDEPRNDLNYGCEEKADNDALKNDVPSAVIADLNNANWEVVNEDRNPLSDAEDDTSKIANCLLTAAGILLQENV
ncbi:tax1-binding protein 1 homolog [Orussus abietinus]|uniref:tax1-binding protein 1 homolog n=1 Tax=Orussus abietinus TaxID=222816 RepID=UPI000C715C7F|nr:tax1-binding protein 1 homolog [Orussus abietinus]